MTKIYMDSWKKEHLKKVQSERSKNRKTDQAHGGVGIESKACCEATASDEGTVRGPRYSLDIAE